MDIVRLMTDNLQPQGNAPISRLFLTNSFFDWEFIQKCIVEIEKMPARVAVGDTPSNLEKLAYELLCDSAYTRE